MSRPQKMHKPLKADFNSILAAVGMGTAKGKQTSLKLARKKRKKNPAASGN